MDSSELGREAYDGDDVDLAAIIEAGIVGMAKQEVARKRFGDNPAKWSAKVRAARRAERGDR